MRNTSRYAANPWVLALDAARFNADVASVIWLRSLRLMQGGPLAAKESRLMVNEKLAAHAALPFALILEAMDGGAPDRLVHASMQHYGGRVRANRRRLRRAAR